jgi:hypothetical protein
MCAVASLVYGGVFVWSFSPMLGAAAGLEGRDDFYARLGHPAFSAFAFVNRTAQPSQRIVLIGEARAFACAGGVRYATVFDVGRGLEIEDGDIVLVNWQEVNRLRETYSFVFDGRREPGYPVSYSPEAFADGRRRGIFEEVARFGADDGRGGDAVVVFRARAR